MDGLAYPPHPAPEPGPGAAPPPTKRARKTYNCETCRRLKIKCDRSYPCQTCVKRGIIDQCVFPDTAAPRKKARPSRAKKAGKEHETERAQSDQDDAIASERERGAKSASTSKGEASAPEQICPGSLDLDLGWSPEQSETLARLPISAQSEWTVPFPARHQSVQPVSHLLPPLGLFHAPAPSSPPSAPDPVPPPRPPPPPIVMGTAESLAQLAVGASALPRSIPRTMTSSTVEESGPGPKSQSQLPPQPQPTPTTSIMRPPPPPPPPLSTIHHLNVTSPLVFPSPDGSLDEQEQDLRDLRAHGRGTLTIGEDGSARYLGPTAGSEWLRQHEDIETVTPCHEHNAPPRSTSRLLSALPPALAGEASRKTSAPSTPPAGADTFPFNMPAADAHQTVAYLWSCVPAHAEDAQFLVEAYYRHMGWNYNVIAKTDFMREKDAIYRTLAGRHDTHPGPAAEDLMTKATTAGDSDGGADDPVSPDVLAVFFAVLAIGSQSNLELPPNHPSGQMYITLAQQALTVSRFLTRNTIRAVQCLHIMGHYYLNVDARGDSSWPLWGMAMRMIEAMGIHRDGTGWGLSEPVIQERPRVFWESRTIDVFQANCFSRPCALHPDYIDTQFPNDEDAHGGCEGFKRLKFRLALLSSSVLHQIMKVDAPDHHKVTALWKDIVQFENSLPYFIRCRPAWSALINSNQSAEDAMRNTPEVRSHDMKLTFQQHMLALNICEAVIFLQRPFFTQAICGFKGNEFSGRFASSMLAVFERCVAIMAIIRSLHSCYPAVVERQWNWWYHGVTSAVCLSSLVTLAPGCILTPFALAELRSFIGIVSSTPPSSRARSSLSALLRMQKRAEARLANHSAGEGSVPEIQDSMLNQMSQMFGVSLAPAALQMENDSEEDEQLAMIGWTTRLIRRLKSGLRTRGVNIVGPPTNSSPGCSDKESTQSPSVESPLASTSRNLHFANWLPPEQIPILPAADIVNSLANANTDFHHLAPGAPMMADPSGDPTSLLPDLDMLAGWGIAAGWFNPTEFASGLLSEAS